MGGRSARRRSGGARCRPLRRSSLMTDLDLGSGATRHRAGARRRDQRCAGADARRRRCRSSRPSRPPARCRSPTPDRRNCRAGPRRSRSSWRRIDVRSPEFAKKVESITSLGDREMRESANVSSRMLERPAAALSNGQRRQGRPDPGRRHAVRTAEPDHRTRPQPGRAHRHQEGAEVDPGRQQDRQPTSPSTSRRRASSTPSSGRSPPARTSSARTTPASRSRRPTCGR